MSGIMGGVDDAVGRVRQYDVFADEFLDHAESGFFNAYYDRPACLALLGDVAGKRVLDAACGPGLYAAELARRGARVVGFDHSPRMVEIAQSRMPRGNAHLPRRLANRQPETESAVYKFAENSSLTASRAVRGSRGGASLCAVVRCLVCTFGCMHSRR
jgi:SAM-dependent methyltransferase